ncbi:hypothetical protein GOBAR_DD17356 [Gossypium barbadense]|nr:hypothetical protein GOBAR_DD17356 [Gossypium barbadense]
MAVDLESLSEATSGALGSLLSTTILYPLDTCKTKYQVEVQDHDKMPRRKILRGSIVQNDPNSTETNSTEQQTAIGSSNVLITAKDPTEVQKVEDVRYLESYTS